MQLFKEFAADTEASTGFGKVENSLSLTIKLGINGKKTICNNYGNFLLLKTTFLKLLLSSGHNEVFV
jgi:hypothetical protein